MVRLEVLQKRINKAEQYLKYLRDIQKKYSHDEFEAASMIYGSVERFLHLTIEALLDIGNHIISDQNLGQVEFYKNIPELLFDNGYINDQQKEIFLHIIGFRNILVHDYLDIIVDCIYSK